MANTGAGPAITPPLGDELARLEEIVRKLEADDVELDTALALFEEYRNHTATAAQNVSVADTTESGILRARVSVCLNEHFLRAEFGCAV